MGKCAHVSYSVLNCISLIRGAGAVGAEVQAEVAVAVAIAGEDERREHKGKQRNEIDWKADESHGENDKVNSPKALGDQYQQDAESFPQEVTRFYHLPARIDRCRNF